MVQSVSERYINLWYSSAWRSGTEEAAGIVMDALLTPDPYAVVLEAWNQAVAACVQAEAENDASRYLSFEEKSAVLRQFLEEWCPV